ncbi:MAG: V-type ATP synthase subunit I [Eubacteriales bacterium]|nr:V-type ATP synthase subunit I [Eubacteriales bacterium]
MAIAVIEKATLVVPKAEQASAFRLLQEFQEIEIIDSSDLNQEDIIPNLLSDQWKKSLNKIEKAQNILSGFIRTNALQKLKNGRPVMTLTELETTTCTSGWENICSEILSSNERIEALRARRIELLRLNAQWAPWEKLNFYSDSSDESLRSTSISVGMLKSTSLTSFIEAFESATSGIGYHEDIFQSGDSSGVVFFYPKKMDCSLKELFKQSDFIPYDFPFKGTPSEMLKIWKSEESEIISEEKALLDKLKDYSEINETLNLAEEFFKNLLIRDDAHKMALETKSIIILNGWIDKENVDELKCLLKQEVKFPYYILFSEVEKHEIEDVPIILKNKKIARAFESLTEMYSMPAYNEIDPTPVMTPFYLVFFGMMVADIGYGVVLLLATLAAKFFFKLDKPLRKNVEFFLYLSFPIILWGIIYGSLFGVSLPFSLLSPSEDIIPILIISIILGWLQLMTGLFVGTYVKMKQKDVLGAFSSGVSWIMFLLGLAILALSKTLFISDELFTVSIIILLLSVFGIVLLPIAENKRHKVKGLLKGLYALYGATGYIGDLVSYTRLMALGIAGSSIAVAFNTITGSLPLVARLTLGVLLAIVLHGLNIFLSMLGAYVHGIRLQYVEFFGKFYSGGGKKFNPFKTIEKHIYITKNNN